MSYSLPAEVVDVGWDGVLSWQQDSDTDAWSAVFKEPLTLYCASLPASWEGSGTAWQNLVAADNECEVFEVEVEVRCEGSWISKWKGTFTSKDWTINYDRLFISVKPTTESPYKCFKDGSDVASNVYGLSEVEVRPDLAGYFTHQEVFSGPPPFVSGFCHYYSFEDIHFYHAYRKNGACQGGVPAPPDTLSLWILFSGGCPGTPVYWSCPETTHVPYAFSNGRLFGAVLELLVDRLNCGLTVVSDFFGINADSTHPANVAYTKALAHCQRLVIFQKSDVKRHDATNKSGQAVWDIKLKEIFDDLWLMFKVKPKIVGGSTLRIEHVSYFEAVAGADYTTEVYTKELEAGEEKIPETTRFEWQNKYCSDYFTGQPITAFCGDGQTLKKLNLFACDVSFVASIDNAEAITDSGWVLMDTFLDGATRRLRNNNSSLSWTELHDAYHRHEMLAAGEINGVDAVPLSIKKSRRQPDFTVSHCCTDDFDPEKYITTSLGQGQVKSAEENLGKDLLTVSLIY